MPYKDPETRRKYASARQIIYAKRHPEKTKEKKAKWYRRSYERRKGKIYEWTKQYRANNPERVKEANKEWREQNKDKLAMWKKSSRSKKKALRDAAAPRPRTDRCEICLTFGEVVYDHDHVSGKFRTWACHRCNRVMGAVYDDPMVLRAIADHLEQFHRGLKNG